MIAARTPSPGAQTPPDLHGQRGQAPARTVHESATAAAEEPVAQHVRRTRPEIIEHDQPHHPSGRPSPRPDTPNRNNNGPIETTSLVYPSGYADSSCCYLQHSLF